MSTRGRSIIVALALSLVLAGIWGIRFFQARREAPNSPASGVPSFTYPLPQVGPSTAWPLCTNKKRGYSIKYPVGWHTTQLLPEQACQWFDPSPFAVEGHGEGPTTALEAYHDNEPFQSAVQGMTDPAVVRTILREPLQLEAGRAVRLEVETKGVIPLPVGTRTYAYIIDLGSRGIFVVSTTSMAGSDYETNKVVVDEAARTVRVF